MNETPEAVLELRMISIYQVLRTEACRLTTATDRVAETLESYQGLLERWVDSELRRIGEGKDLSSFKLKVAQAVQQLVDTRCVPPVLATNDLSICATCGLPLSLAWFGERVCLQCAAPVVEALDDLVRATTIRYTPQHLFDEWKKSHDSYLRLKAEQSK